MSQVTVAIYHNTVPNAKSQEKIDLLRFFSLGVRLAGDRNLDIRDYNYQTTDVAVIQGWVTENVRPTQHQLLRDTVIKKQIENKRYVVGVDSNLFLYANKENPFHYLRYSFNGVFPNTGIYCDTNIDPTRWKKISKNIGIELKPYRSTGNHILLCLQRNGGWSMGNYDVQDWAIQTIQQIRKYSNRPIVLRGHPGDKAAREYLDPKSPKCRLKGISNIYFSSFDRSLVQDLQNCWAAVNHNSSPVVGALIEGIPIFVTDPDKSQCKEVANVDLSQIENPQMPDRQQWVERLSMFHWNFDELRSGECWAHMKNFVL
jgi:hypothetical protein